MKLGRIPEQIYNRLEIQSDHYDTLVDLDNIVSEIDDVIRAIKNFDQDDADYLEGLNAMRKDYDRRRDRALELVHDDVLELAS